MLFKVEENKRTCKNAEEDAGDHEDDHIGMAQDEPGKATPCQLDTNMTITGPVAVYGTFAGPVNSTMMFHNQVSLTWSLGTDYSKKNTELVGSFTASSPNFQQALLKVLEFAKFRPVFAEQFAKNPVRPTMKQAVRVIRSMNEEILKGQ